MPESSGLESPRAISLTLTVPEMKALDRATRVARWPGQYYPLTVQECTDVRNAQMKLIAAWAVTGAMEKGKGNAVN